MCRVLGYKPKSVRKRKNSSEKENVSGNSAKRFSFPLSPLTTNSLVESQTEHATPGTLNSRTSTLEDGECYAATDPVFSEDSDSEFGYDSSSTDEDYNPEIDVHSDSGLFSLL
ncbi:hypothetical protein ACET3Z_030998 [Daucus carota]